MNLSDTERHEIAALLEPVRAAALASIDEAFAAGDRYAEWWAALEQLDLSAIAATEYAGRISAWMIAIEAAASVVDDDPRVGDGWTAWRDAIPESIAPLPEEAR